MITRRDLIVALVGVGAALGITALAAERPPVMRSSAFDWTAIPAKPTNVGAVRQFFRAPTATLDELELHVTTLNPGQTSHAPHVHANEELVIVKEGAVEALVNGEWKKLGPGSVIFNSPNELHGLKSVGDVPAVYHVINWRTPAAASPSTRQTP
jgi:XRE family transcriptional regulator, regulator of sulfur utilization